MKKFVTLVLCGLLLAGCASGSGGRNADVKSFDDYNNPEEQFLKGDGF